MVCKWFLIAEINSCIKSYKLHPLQLFFLFRSTKKRHVRSLINKSENRNSLNQSLILLNKNNTGKKIILSFLRFFLF